MIKTYFHSSNTVYCTSYCEISDIKRTLYDYSTFTDLKCLYRLDTDITTNKHPQ